MGGKLKVDWREPEKLHDALSSGLVPTLIGASLQSITMAGVILGIGWLSQDHLSPKVELPWAVMFIVAVALVFLPIVFFQARTKNRYRLTDSWVGGLDGSPGVCRWDDAVCFKVQAATAMPAVDMLCVCTESSLGWLTGFWRWFSKTDVEVDWSWVDVPLPDDTSLARRIVAEAERRLPRLAELPPERRRELDGRLERARHPEPSVILGWVDVVWFVVGSSLAGALCVWLLRMDFYPEFGNGLLWVLATLLPMLVIGPATWLALYHHGRAGFARSDIRSTVFLLNWLAMLVAMAAIFAGLVLL